MSLFQQENANMDNSTGNKNSNGGFRLRASCNACNESKLRCSQTKPTCVRCERNVVVCMYGLSRRSHRDAPRIKSTSNSRPLSSGSSVSPYSHHNYTQHYHTNSQNQNTNPLLTSTSLHIPNDFNFFSQPGAAAFNFSSQLPDELIAAGFPHGREAFLSMDQIEGVTSPAKDDSNIHQSLPLSSGGNSWSSLDTTDIEQLSTTQLTQSFQPPSLSKQQQQQQQPTTQPPQSFQPPSLSKQQQEQPSKQDGDISCTCNSEATPYLARASQFARTRDGKKLSFDVELSQLKRAILACEASMSCQEHSSDPTVTMIIGALVGNILNGFEMLLADKSCSNISSSSSTSSTTEAATTGGATTPITSASSTSSDEVLPDAHIYTHSQTPDPQPRLTWGVLHLSDEDETELRNRLCILCFRRLGGLLKHFNQSVRMVREAQTSEVGGAVGSNSAFVMACEYMRMWLEQKAEAVREGLVTYDQCTLGTK